jgi:argonaute-like protein implicated in RNA metabolism and viral defense
VSDVDRRHELKYGMTVHQVRDHAKHLGIKYRHNKSKTELVKEILDHETDQLLHSKG